MPLPIDLDQIKSEFLRQCGIHDYGLVGFACNCPNSDPRWIISALVFEVELLQAKIAKYESEGGKNDRIPKDSGTVQAVHGQDDPQPDDLRPLG